MASGLIAIVHVGLYGPEFATPTRDQLRSPAGRTAVAAVLLSCLERGCNYQFETFLKKRLQVPIR
jgi:hypothetical protein